MRIAGQQHLKQFKNQLAQSNLSEFEQKKLSVTIKYMEETDMAVVISQSQNEVEAFQKKELNITPHRQRLVSESPPLDEKFKDPSHRLRIIFVCAMWMTGFDVPSCSTIYLDKPMKNHSLMQTIARANRVFPGKVNGLIVEHKDCTTKSLKISITQGDRYLLERFLSDTEFTGSVSLDQAKESIINGRKLNVKPTVSISVSCAQEWFVDLEKNFKITPRKSLTLQPPENLDRECSLAYIKGFFDGDGCAHIRKNGYLNIVFYGTFECLTWIQLICDEIAPNYTDDWRDRQRKTANVFQRDKIFNYCIGEYRAEILAKEILKLDIPGMKRKWDKIQEHLNKREQEFDKIRQETQVYIFDSSKVYLGRLCKKGHDYLGTGKSLRRVGHGTCVICGQINSQVKEPLVPIKFWIEQTKTLRPDIDINKFYLGSLCSKEHNFEGLRRLSSRICLQCEEVKRKAKDEQRLIHSKKPNHQQSLSSQIEHTKIVAPEIDTSQFYLATLCKHKHEYAATGKSLRRIIGGDCVECKGQRHLIKVQQFLHAYKAGKYSVEIDVDKYWLGELCKEKHNYQGTGLSLREQKFNYCVECRKK